MNDNDILYGGSHITRKPYDNEWQHVIICRSIDPTVEGYIEVVGPFNNAEEAEKWSKEHNATTCIHEFGDLIPVAWRNAE